MNKLLCLVAAMAVFSGCSTTSTPTAPTGTNTPPAAVSNLSKVQSLISGTDIVVALAYDAYLVVAAESKQPASQQAIATVAYGDYQAASKLAKDAAIAYFASQGPNGSLTGFLTSIAGSGADFQLAASKVQATLQATK